MLLRNSLRQAARLVLAGCLALTGCGNDCSGSCGTVAGPTDIRLEVDTYIAGLDKPWDIAWLPNGTLLLSERTGQLKVFVDGVDEPPSVIPIADVVARGEGGLMGLEIDPSFASNGFIYVCTTSSAGGDNDVRLLRLTMSRPDGAAVLERSDIVTGMPYSSGRHSGCRPRFGPDGFLWVGTGDAAIGANPQDDASLGGKVLRIDRDGAAAPGNPGGFVWYSKGHRNVQGMAFRSDGIGVSAEHGPSVDDELNLLVPGNFGWDPVPGYNESVPMTDLAKFPDAVEAIWSSGSPTLALSGATFLEGEAWGDWNGALAVATLKAQHLHVYFIDAEGEVTGDERAIGDQGRLRSPRQGPDGLLYITNDGGSGDGKVLRVRPVPIAPAP
jgi:glucose/arabinose dehydrogenase